MEEAQNEKTRLENNQRQRKKQLIADLQGKREGFDKDHDPTYYEPKYFVQQTHPVTGDAYYDFQAKNRYNSNYWSDRERGDFSHLPRIYEDGCEPFFH